MTVANIFNSPSNEREPKQFYRKPLVSDGHANTKCNEKYRQNSINEHNITRIARASIVKYMNKAKMATAANAIRTQMETADE